MQAVCERMPDLKLAIVSQQLASPIAPIRVFLADDWYVETVAPGVDARCLGLYEWHIEGAGCYIGVSARASQTRRLFSLVLARLLNGLPYRKGKPIEYHHVHRELAAALVEGRHITLFFSENVSKPTINERERALIRDRGSLNVPPFGRVTQSVTAPTLGNLRRSRFTEDKSKLRAELVKRAKERSTALYGEMAALLGRASQGLGTILDAIREDEASGGRPDLSCLVVTARTGLPGHVGREAYETEEALAVRERVFATWERAGAPAFIQQPNGRKEADDSSVM